MCSLNIRKIRRILKELSLEIATPAEARRMLGLKGSRTVCFSGGTRERRTGWVHADEAKGREAIVVPLNDQVMAVLREKNGKHPEHVFTYRGRPPGQVNTRSWRNALKRAGVANTQAQ